MCAQARGGVGGGETREDERRNARGGREEDVHSFGGVLALWHPGGVFLLNCLSSTAVMANEKLKSTLTPDPAPAPVLTSAFSARCPGRSTQRRMLQRPDPGMPWADGSPLPRREAGGHSREGRWEWVPSFSTQALVSWMALIISPAS